ncbi:MAG TPA: alpha/beta hydrolase-fold protein [Flavisolibacter sp.]|nr:alpha/beta hydrolase-fold protein [Flavisolibacter sp.]
MKLCIILSLAFLQLLNTVQAQNLPGARDSIYSEVLKENRILQVLLPENYKPGSKEKYDVVYLLDGKDNIKLLSAIQEFAEAEKYMPPLIIVAIFNTNRNRDLTPTPMANISSSGGAANFLSFLKKELVPYINKTYPANGENILYGHSFGGLFAMYALLNEPQLFSSYLAVDPSFWYDGGYMNKQAAEKLAGIPKDKLLFISGREDNLGDMGIDSMEAVLKAKAPAGMPWKMAAYENETHGSVKLKSMYDGLRFLYSGYEMKSAALEFHPMNGIVLKDKPYTVFSFGNYRSLRYTTNGSMPTAASAKMEKENTFTGPVELNIKSFTHKGRYDKIAKGHFVLGEAPEPLTKADKLTQGGLSYTYYEGRWDSIPDFKKLKAVQSGFIDKDFTFQKLPSKTNFSCLFQGYIEIKEEGYYIFVLDADDGAKLFLKDKLLIDYDGQHSRRESQTFLLPLKKGFYPVRVEYFQKEEGMDLRLGYVTPGSKKPVPVPLEVQYRRN